MMVHVLTHESLRNASPGQRQKNMIVSIPRTMLGKYYRHKNLKNWDIRFYCHENSKNWVTIGYWVAIIAIKILKIVTLYDAG